jgi:hypothetical protein
MKLIAKNKKYGNLILVNCQSYFSNYEVEDNAMKEALKKLEYYESKYEPEEEIYSCEYCCICKGLKKKI